MNEEKKNTKFINTIFIICLYIFIFQEFLEKFIPIMQYFDELFALMIIPVFIIKNRNILSNGKLSINKSIFRQFKIIAIFIIIGIFSSCVYKYQNFNISIQDFIVCIKFPFSLWLSNFLFKRNELNSKKIHFHISAISIIFFFLTIINIVNPIFDVTYRNNIVANQLFYSHAAKLLAISVFLIALNILFFEKGSVVNNILLNFIIITTWRAKAIGFIAFEIFLLIYLKISKKKKISLSKIGFIGLICFMIVFDQISVYFFENTNTARYQLLHNSISIARDHFPLGSGFATYGSHASTESYSILYYNYNLNNIYGLSKANSKFASDSFWPMILGQFGFIGLILYLWFVFTILREIQNMKITEKNNKFYISKLLCMVYLLMSSISESSFVNSFSIPLALILGMCNNDKIERNNKNKDSD